MVAESSGGGLAKPTSKMFGVDIGSCDDEKPKKVSFPIMSVVYCPLELRRLFALSRFANELVSMSHNPSLIILL